MSPALSSCPFLRCIPGTMWIRCYFLLLGPLFHEMSSGRKKSYAAKTDVHDVASEEERQEQDDPKRCIIFILVPSLVCSCVCAIFPGSVLSRFGSVARCRVFAPVDHPHPAAMAPPYPPSPRPPHVRTPCMRRLLPWFLDSPATPFGVHRMALAQGKDVGMWFGPGAAAAAVRWGF
ncbi:hypothetical protein C8J57DRAFT_1517612 [Mycena rebaudengoi]|nr:hypothetical protein C8J57DRAFT_1517612 [Mycena rebaudengoi]